MPALLSTSTIQLPVILLHAAVYCFIFWIISKRDIARLSIVVLAIPYFIFLPGWLNTPVALISTSIFACCIWQSFKTLPAAPAAEITTGYLLAYLLILAWLHVSGAGGYGHQCYDYVAHNARLNDLIIHNWPLRYDETRWGQEHNLVYYMGYIMPAALIGKFSSFSVAQELMHYWTLILLFLCFHWLALLSGWKLSIILVLIFILFGPQDILGTLLLWQSKHLTFAEYFHKAWQGDWIEFWASENSFVFFGNFLSNTSQFFWSPQQVLAGWLMMGLLTWLYEQRALRALVFIYSLLCLWAPLPMIALLPFVAYATLPTFFRTPGKVFTLENVLGAGTITGIFVTYYLSSAVDSNLSYWIWTDELPLSYKLLMIALFYLFTWGLYALATRHAAKFLPEKQYHWYIVLLLAMFVLPLHSYGNYNDLMCRGSAPLMFLLLIYLLRSYRYYQLTGQLRKQVILGACFLLGTLSALSQLSIAFQEYGKLQPVRSVTDYRESHETLGPDDTFFNKYLRKSMKP